MWRVMNGLHKRITLSFMIPGHTKFAPDRYFGLFKIKYRRSTTDCLRDLVMCANNCTGEQTVAQVYGRHLGLEKNAFEYSKWDEYLSSYFKPLDGILRYNCFSFDHEEPGVVRFSVNSDDRPDSVNILKNKYHRFQLPLQYPPAAVPPDLDLKRKMYLYKEIRQFVKDPQKRDMTCPFPGKG